jgi:hypothetical protein
VRNRQKKISKGNSEGVKHFTPSEFPFDICFVCSSLYTFWVPLWYLFCLFFTLHHLRSPLISFLSALHFTPSEFPLISKGNSEGVKWGTDKTDIKGELRRCKVRNRQKKNIKGELRRCKVRNRQKRYQIHLLSSPLISVLSALHFTPSEFPFDIFFVCSSLYTFWVPLWYLFCLFFTLHLGTDKKDIKGELRRCKVKNKQKRYQRGTQKV